MMRKTIALLVSTSMLSACFAFRGPQPALGSSGVVMNDHQGQARREFIFERFRDTALEAAGCLRSRIGVPGEPDLERVRCDERNVPDSERATIMKRYMRSGFLLISSNCHEYLDVMARYQGRTRIARDLISPITNLITGILSLHNIADGERQDWLTGITIASSAATAGLDIIDQRFLFGSDNIASVRELVMRALGAQANEALSKPDNQLNFELASNEILANQAMCTPSGILRLTRNAIQNAPVAPTSPPQDGSKPDRLTTGTNNVPNPTNRVAPSSVDVPQPQ